MPVCLMGCLNPRTCSLLTAYPSTKLPVTAEFGGRVPESESWSVPARLTRC